MPHAPIPPFPDPQIAARFAACPAPARTGMLALRDLIFEIAAEDPRIGPLQETLKWGQPAYLTAQSKSGTTLRLGQPKTGGFGLYVHCQTTLIAEFRTNFGTEFTYDGNRGVLFDAAAPLPRDKLALLIGAALTYHIRAKP